jgi:hypothetical protein
MKSVLFKITFASIIVAVCTWMFFTSVYYILSEETFAQVLTSTNVKLSMLIGGWYPSLLVSTHIFDNQ